MNGCWCSELQVHIKTLHNIEIFYLDIVWDCLCPNYIKKYECECSGQNYGSGWMKQHSRPLPFAVFGSGEASHELLSRDKSFVIDVPGLQH